MMLNKGRAPDGKQLLSERSVELMTSNHLTPNRWPTVTRPRRAWLGYGVGVLTQPDAEWPVPGRYGWAGGYGTTWFNDPHSSIIAIAITQVSDVLWNGTSQSSTSSWGLMLLRRDAKDCREGHEWLWQVHVRG